MVTYSKQEIGTFMRLFVRNGYVLDFTNNNFDIFTMDSVGVAIREKYNLSKGKSLVIYVHESLDKNIIKIINDLFTYYKENFEYEYNRDYKDDLCWGESRFNTQYSMLYEKCSLVYERINALNSPLTATAEKLKLKFSSEYLSKQIDLMVSMQNSNPTDAIGKAKELIESCCKTILEEMGKPLNKDWDVPRLASETMNALELLPENIQPSDQGTEAIKAVLGSLRAIPSKLAEIRNPFGSGHGKSASFVGLEERHAKLAVGSSITFVDFVWSTYEVKKRKEHKF